LWRVDSKLPPKFCSKTSAGSEVHLAESHLLSPVQLHGYPSFKIIQAAEPDSKVISSHQSGRLDDEALAAIMVVHPPSQTAIEIRRVDADDGDEVLEGTHEGRVLPMPVEDGKDTRIDDKVRPLLGERSRRIRLTPEIDPYREPQAAEIRVEDAIDSVAGNNLAVLLVCHAHMDLALSSHNATVAIKKRGRAEPFATRSLQQSSDEVTAKAANHFGQSLLARPGKTGRETGDIYSLSPKLLKKANGVTYVSGVVQFRIGFPLNNGNANILFHGRASVRRLPVGIPISHSPEAIRHPSSRSTQ
jgi:hypothetical protein